MHLLLIRHGQSTNNHFEETSQALEGRHPDPPLTEVGQLQATRLASWVAQDAFFQGITQLYTSLTTRAVQTAMPLSQALNLSVHGLVQAYECGGLNSGPQGGFTPVIGRDQPSLLEDCPALLWPKELQGRAWDGGWEPWDSALFGVRAARVTAQVAMAASDTDIVALITHHDFAQYLIANVLHLPDIDGEKVVFRLNNTAVTHIELTGGSSGIESRILHYLNRTPHLTQDLVTG